MVLEPGLDLHDWETRWQQLCELAVDSPDEALQELAEAAETTEFAGWSSVRYDVLA